MLTLINRFDHYPPNNNRTCRHPYSCPSLISKLFFIHKSLGLTLLLLGIIFVLWRFCHHRPAHHHSTMPAWQHISAKIMHLALFTLIIIMLLSGWMMSSSADYPPVFGDYLR